MPNFGHNDYVSDGHFIHKASKANAVRQPTYLGELANLIRELAKRHFNDTETHCQKLYEIIYQLAQEVYPADKVHKVWHQNTRTNQTAKGDHISDQLSAIGSVKGPGHIGPYLAWLWQDYPEEAAKFYESVSLNPRPYILDTKNSISPAPKPTISILETSHPLDGLTQDQKDRIDQIISGYVKDHEPHPAEADFEQFIAERDRGYWFLTAGPGMGKSAVMANLAIRLSQEFTQCLPYFFRYSSIVKDESNSPSGFYEYLFSMLANRYGIAKQQDISFEKYLFILSDRELISKENPLILIVDSLDEMHGALNNGYAARQSLKLPARIPAGVFIALSERLSSPVESDLFSDLKAVHLNAPEYFEGHKETARRYTHKICQEYKYIAPYHKSKKDQSNFVESLCEKANYNFMFLKCLLHDENYWHSGGQGNDLTGNLNDYYRSHLKRMAEAAANPRKEYAALCFSLESRISHYLIEELFKAEVVTADLYQWLEQWEKQGLVLEETVHLDIWLRAYHKTFKQFLENERGQNRARLLEFYSESLYAAFKDQDRFARLENQSGDVLAQCLRLMLEWLRETGKTAYLSKLLLNLDFWLMAEKTPEKISTIISCIARIAPKVENQRKDFEVLISKVADKIREWIDSKQLPYKLMDVYQIAEGASQDRRPEYKPICITDYLLK